MPVPKYIKMIAGVLTEQAATVTPVADSIVSTDNTGTIPVGLLPTGIGADTAPLTATEALAAGDLVNIYSASGAFRCRKADASVAGKEAHGFVLAAVLNTATATVYFEGSDPQVSGLTPGVQYLSTTPGLATGTAPTGTGNVVQRVGFAVSATNLNFQSEVPVVLA